ncbi:MAG: DUF1080 domain-containing protein [Verrucomicrobia bacterium]|nr:DUF1080 domain-containing protein [Verrucomicrobiota bacterium]
MRKSLVFLGATVAAALVGAAELPAPNAEGWIPLFNGKNLDGWKVKIRGYPLGENYARTFRVEDGLLKVAYDPKAYPKFNNRFGHIFYQTPFSNYVLRVEYRFVGKQVPGGAGWAFRNSGVMFHCQSPESMGLNQDFPVSIEMQLLGGDGVHERPTANLCTPGTNVEMDGKLITRHCTNSSSRTYHGDQWVLVELEVHGNRLVRHLAGGKTVLVYSKPQLDPRDPLGRKLIQERGGEKMLYGGYISLQSESHPVQFRKVEIKLLPAD